MSTYIYTGLDSKGNRVSGELEGQDVTGIKRNLKEAGIYIISVHEKVSAPSFLSVRRVNESDLVLVMRELATFVSSKLPLDECFTGVTSQMKSTRLKTVFLEIQKKIREGSSFSDALKGFPGIFSQMIISLVKAGEETGTLDDILLKIADLLEKKQSFKNKIMSIMSYPVFMLFISAAVFVFLLTFVTPTMTRIFSDIDMELPGPTLILIQASSFMQNFWFYLVIGAGVIFYFVKQFLISDNGKRLLDFVLLRVPVLNNIILKKEIIVFSGTMASLIDGGVDIIESLSIARRVVNSYTLREEIKEIMDFLSKGGALSSAFKNSSHFPFLVTQLINAGERSGSLSEMFKKIGQIYEEEITQSSTRFVTFIEPVMILFMGAVVGVIVLAILLPIFQISQAIR